MRAGQSVASSSAAISGVVSHKLLAILATGLLAASMAAQAEPIAYVTTFHSTNVSVINTATNTISTTIAVSGNPEGIAITPDGAFTYVASELLGRVSAEMAFVQKRTANQACGNR